MSERFSKVPRHAFSDDRLKRSDLKVLGALCQFLGKTNEGWPSQALVAEKAGVGLRTAVRSLAHLRQYGYLTIQPRRLNGMKGACRYKVEFGPPAELILFPGNVANSDTPEMADLENKEITENLSNDRSAKAGATDLADTPPVGVSIRQHGGRTRTTQENRSSVPNGTGAAAPEGDSPDEGDGTLMSSAELKKSVIWATGKPLLASQGVSKESAGKYLGGLIKDCGLDAVYHAFVEAAKKPPIEAKGWLRRVAEIEGLRLGTFKGKLTAKPQTTDWQAVLARWWASGAWPANIGEAPSSVEYTGPEDALDALLSQAPADHPTRVECERARMARLRRTA